jgi:Transmembrane family, TMEM144 of transporters
VGTWSSIIVLTSFVFGIIVFQEKVKNIYYTCYSFIILVIGLIGMAKYAAGTDEPDQPPKKITSRRRAKSLSMEELPPSTEIKHKISSPVTSPGTQINLQPMEMEMEPLLDENGMDDSIIEIDINDDSDPKDLANKDRIIFCGGRMALTRHQTGVIGAIINGAWGGLNLIPVHYARRDDGMTGAAFLVSFATGSLIVNTVLWILLIAYQWYQKKGNWEEVKQALPKFHLEHLWKAGLGAGLLYSIGNFSALLAVTYLGQGVGFSFCQLQLLVSGLWGVFYFKEIRGQERIFKWFMSAGVAVLGIICLSYQHEGSGAGHRRLMENLQDLPFLLW